MSRAFGHLLPAKSIADLCFTVAAQQMQQQRLQAIQHQRQQAMMAQSMGQMQPGAMYGMQPNNYAVHPQQLAQLQAMQSRVMAQRPQQVCRTSHPFPVHPSQPMLIQGTGCSEPAGKTRMLHAATLN